MTMKFVPTEEDVKVGDKVVTSGMDKIFPRDIPVGTVVDVKNAYPFKVIRVEPAAKLDRLETVIVLLTQEPVEFKTEAPSAPTGAQAGEQNAANPAAAAKSEKP